MQSLLLVYMGWLHHTIKLCKLSSSGHHKLQFVIGNVLDMSKTSSSNCHNPDIHCIATSVDQAESGVHEASREGEAGEDRDWDIPRAAEAPDAETGGPQL